MAIKCKGVLENLVFSLKKDIEDYDFSGGSRLKPARQLADKYNVSYVTMRKALNKLEQEGLLVIKQGSGTFIKIDADMSSNDAQNTKSVTFVFVSFTQAIRNLHIYSWLLESVERNLRDSNLSCSITYIHTPEDVKYLSARKTDGYILMGIDNIKQLRQALKDKPCVWAMGPDDKTWGDHITYNDFSVGKLAADYLAGRGHKNLAVMSSQLYYSVFGRSEGFRLSAKKHGCESINFTDENVLTVNEQGNYVEQAIVERWVEDVLNSTPMPTGIFVSNDAMIPMVSNVFSRRGIDVGKDIEIIGCDGGVDIMHLLTSKLVSIDIKSEDIGRLAVEQVKWRMKNFDKPRQIIKVEPAIKL